MLRRRAGPGRQPVADRLSARVDTCGTLVLSGGGSSGGGSFIGPMGLFIRGRVLARFVRHRLVAPVTTPGVEQLATLRDFAESGTVTPVIDRVYPLSEVSEAIRYLEVEHASGKVVITM